MRTEEEIRERMPEIEMQLKELAEKIRKEKDKQIIITYLRKRVRLETRKEMLQWVLGGQCYAKIFHGPGHQSRTNCQVQGPHKVHEAVYGNYQQDARWTGDERCSGYFDEAPDVDE